MSDHEPDPLRTSEHAPDSPTGAAPVTVPTDVPGAAAPTLSVPAGAPVGASLVVPGYEVLGELGRGGMGVVFRARHLKLNREVALKTLRTTSADRRDRIRFLAEAEAVAAIKHPNVVQVYDYGEAADRPYMALEYVPGGALTGRLGAPLAPAEAARLLAPVARGVAAAHAGGIVHRDLKPDNVLLAADGTPKVSDFGLAKRAANDLTAAEAVMGTPAYMSPEQADGRAKFVGPPADVWALGVMLYECAYGRRPFRAAQTRELLAQIVRAEPEFPRDRRAPRDLVLICRKCLEKNPADRYPTAAELADDLERFAAGEPISVRPAGSAERAYKWARREPRLAAAVGAAFGLLLGLVAVAYSSAATERELTREARGEAKKARDASAETAAANAELRARSDDLVREVSAKGAALAEVTRQKERAERGLYGTNLPNAYQDWQNNKAASTRRLLAECPERLRGWEWRYLDRVSNSPGAAAPPLAGKEGACEVARALGRSVAVARLQGAPGERPRLVAWDAVTAKEVFADGAVALYGKEAFFAKSRTFAYERHVKGSSFGVRAVDTAAPDRAVEIPLKLPVVAMAAHPTESVAAVCTSRRPQYVHPIYFGTAGPPAHLEPELVIFSADGRERRTVLTGADADADHLAWTEDGKSLIHVGPQAVRVIDRATGAVAAQHPLRGPTPALGGVALTPDGQAVLLWSEMSIAQVHLKTGALTPFGSGVGTGPVAYSRSGKLFAAQAARLGAGLLGVIQVNETAPGGRRWQLRGQQRVTSVVVAPDDKTVFTTGADGLRRWSLDREPEVDEQPLSPILGQVRRSGFMTPQEVWLPRTGDLAVVRASEQLQTATAPVTDIALIDLASRRVRARLATNEDRVRKLNESAAGNAQALLAGIADVTLDLTANIAPDGRHAAVAQGTRLRVLRSDAPDAAVRTWDYEHAVDHIAFSRDGATMAVAVGLHVHVYTFPDGKPKAVLRDSVGAPRSPNQMLPARVALSPDGGRVLVAPRLGRQWHIWDVRTQRIEGSTDAAGDLLTFQDAEFGPDGNTLVAFVSATGTEKLGRLLVIDVPGGAVRARPEINFRVSGIDFTPQGRMLVLEDGGRLGVWTTDDWREICGVPLVTGYGARLAGAVRASADGATVRAVIGNTVARWSAPP